MTGGRAAVLLALALPAAAGAPAAEADPPRVRILAPGPRQAAVGTTLFEVAVDAAPGTRVTRVEMIVDGHTVAVLRQPPWRATFDAGEAFRPHTLRAIATDSAGRTGSTLGTTLYVGLVEEVTVVGAEARRVAVPVGVLDREGHPVAGLEAGDFQVRIGRRPALVLAVEQDGRPLAVEVLLDISGSLLPYWSQTREAVHRFLDRLEPEDGSEILVFAGSLHRLSPFGRDHEAAAARIGWLDRDQPPGFVPWGTRLYDSLAAGIEEINVREGQRSLLVLTDTFDSSSSLSWEDLEPVVRQAGLRLDVVRFGRPAAQRWSSDRRLVRRMEKLAEASGGRVWRIRYPEDIPTTFESLARELKSRYRLVVAPDEAVGAGLQRLRVSLEGRRGRVVAPAAVSVPPAPGPEPPSTR